ncbi:MAG TPA: hypothetical protein VNF99_14990 [Stellaceae bacterium]|nr:hypothetical protein [Stellaceae bacterium]
MSFIAAAKPHHRPHFRLVSTAALPLPQEPRIDPVALTVMAVNRLGLATFRTVTSGKVSTVAVPDARTAEIFRAALQEMQKARSTDRLVDVIVTVEDRPGGRGRDAAQS